MSLFSLGVQSRFKMSLWEKMLLSIKTAHSVNFTLFTSFNTSDSLRILEGQRKPFFGRRATRTFLRICRVIIYRNMAMLLNPSLSWLARADTRGMLVTQLTLITICPRHRPLPGSFYRAPKSCQVTSLAGKHVINFQMAVETCFLFGKTIILLLSDRVSVISFAGFGYFFSESWVISNSKITYLNFVAFNSHLNFRVEQSPSPVQKFAQMLNLRVI